MLVVMVNHFQGDGDDGDYTQPHTSPSQNKNAFHFTELLRKHSVTTHIH